MYARTERDLLTHYMRQTSNNTNGEGVVGGCPFLVKLHATFQSPTHLFFLLDYHNGGDLATQLSHQTFLPEPVARIWSAQILSGLEHLHRSGIVYRDLKPENILIAADGRLVLTDFGLAKVLNVRSLQEGDLQKEDNSCWISARTFCGTAEYLAPEILLGYDYGQSVDLWSFGTLLYELLYGIVCEE